MNLTIAPDGMRNERCGELMDVLCITVYAPITASVDYTRVRYNTLRSAIYHCFNGRGMWENAVADDIKRYIGIFT